MDINLIQTIVFAIFLAYFIIKFFKGFAALMELLFTKIILYFKTKNAIKNVDAEYIDFLKGENDAN